MPRLDRRLKAVATLIRAPVHADVGSDHGHLLKALLAAGRIDHGIAIENKTRPFENSRATLAGLDASVVFADGLGGLGGPGRDVDSLSLCGMGGRKMVEILTRFPRRVPDQVVFQPNRDAERVRRWAVDSGFPIEAETITPGERRFVVIRVSRIRHGVAEDDYAGIERAAGLLFGPTLIRRRDPVLVDNLDREIAWLRGMPRLEAVGRRRLAAAEWTMDYCMRTPIPHGCEVEP